MNIDDIAQYLMINEPTFELDGKQYSVCYINGVWGTWDSSGNTYDFCDINELLDDWIVAGKSFRQIVSQIM